MYRGIFYVKDLFKIVFNLKKIFFLKKNKLIFFFEPIITKLLLNLNKNKNVKKKNFY